MRSFFVVLSLASVVTVHAECVGERGLVKVASDEDAKSISLGVIPTTIAYLRTIPAMRPLPQESRVAPEEKTFYSVTATLTEYRVDTNGNAQLVLSDEAGRTLFAQIPAAACLDGSRFASDIDAAHRAFDIRFRPTNSWQSAMMPIEIRGIAFFDFLHGQRGMASNGLTIHPITFINFAPLAVPTPPKRIARRRVAAPSLSTCRMPSVTLNVSKSSACANESVTLTWQASDPAARVTIDGVGTTLPASGTTPVTSSRSSAYSGHATNGCGVGDESVAVVAVSEGSASLSGAWIDNDWKHGDAVGFSDERLVMDFVVVAG